MCIKSVNKIGVYMCIKSVNNKRHNMCIHDYPPIPLVSMFFQIHCHIYIFYFELILHDSVAVIINELILYIKIV